MQAGHADPGRCPGENTVVELLEAELAPERRAAFGQHVDRCDSCRALVAVMARSYMTRSQLGKRLRYARAGDDAAADAGGEGGPLRPGDQLGRYCIEELLGQGGMGAVYAARDPELGRRVAVKVIRPGLAAYGDVVAARLAREARAMAQVAHPNVIAVHDVGHAGGQVFVAMELVAGGTLRAWLAARPRRWREVLEVFRAAGEGLAAAHAARLVHRDFKPDNVLVDPAGRVRVTDFGLARALVDGDRAGAGDAAGAADAAARPGPNAGSGEPDPRVPLTLTGATIGTPAYMAPEQHAQLATDERTDQFAFCVALWEALFGERPFAGDTALALAEQVVNGRLRPLPRRPRLPGWLRRALLRGLRLRPDQRFPSMRALLDAIRPRRSRALIAAAAAALLAVGGGIALAAATGADLGGGEPRACAGEASRVESVWNDGRRAALRTALAATPVGQARWQLIEQALDRYARGWVRMATGACEAGERGDESGELRDLRAHCLDTRLADLHEVVVLLDTTDPLVADNAIKSVDGLPPLARCSAVEVVEARTPIPDDPAERDRVDALRRELLRADVMRLAGRYRESRALLESLRDRAEAVGYRPLIADVLYYLGNLEASTGRAADAEATLRRAAHTAEASRYDQLAADSWILLIETATQSTGDLARAAEYAEHARAALDRLGDHTRLEAQYEHHMGILDWSRSRPDDALVHFAAARRGFEEAGEAAEALSAREGMALVYEEKGRLDDALRINRGVLAARTAMLGADHPDTALSRSNLASTLMLVGRHQEALEEMQRALAIRERTNGPDHVDTAQALHNVGELLRHLGRYAEALDHHRRALAIFERELGPDHQMVGSSLENIAGVYLELDDLAEALPRLRRALDIFVAALGGDHAETVRARINLADGLRHAGRHRDALAEDQAALAALGRGMGLDNVYAAHAELGLGLDQLGLGRAAAARAPLERAMATMEKTGEDPIALARAQFGLARALWPDPAARGRARQLAAAAASALAGAHGEDERLARQATGWLKAHRP